jgi:hypothetical protein
MECLLLLLLIYLASVFSMYKWIQIAYYHPNGRFNSIKPDEIDLFFCFVPIINTVCGILFWMVMFPINFKRTSNFFKPKNK